MAKGFAGSDAIRLEGLRELSRALKLVEAGLQKEIPKALRPIAERVASKARGRLPKRSGRLARSLRPYATQRAVGVRMGRKSVPYAGPVEFGGHPKGRPFIAEGRYIYPTFRQEAPTATREIEEALEGLIKRTGLG